MTTVKYERTHMSPILIGAVILIEVWLLSTILTYGLGLLHIVGTVFVFVVLISVFCIRVVVDYDSIKLVWGVGFLSKELMRSDVESVVIERNRVLLPWFYQPFAEHVLMLRLRGGGVEYLPTSNAKQLQQILQLRI